MYFVRTRIGREQMLMRMAHAVSMRSTCSRNQVGALIARDARVISTGYNGTPAGMPHCIHTDDEPCTEVVHAEANAIVFAARHGISTEGANLYTTLSPCVACAKLIINAGIKEAVFCTPYRLNDGIDMLEKGGVVVGRLDEVKGIRW